MLPSNNRLKLKRGDRFSGRKIRFSWGQVILGAASHHFQALIIVPKSTFPLSVSRHLYSRRLRAALIVNKQFLKNKLLIVAYKTIIETPYQKLETDIKSLCW